MPAPTVIRHRSVQAPALALLQIRGQHVQGVQEVIITARDGNTVTVEHANGWTRTLRTQSGSSDGGVYVETDARTPGTMTFRLLAMDEGQKVA